MDNSEQYILMSDCPEVQKYRKKQKDFQVGDLIANYVLGKYSKANFQGIVVFEQFDEIRDRQLVVWLPRQGQVQEMMGDFNMILPMLPRVERLDKTCGEKFTSMEQLWLAFYMCEKHKKIWSSKEEKWLSG